MLKRLVTFMTTALLAVLLVIVTFVLLNRFAAGRDWPILGEYELLTVYSGSMEPAIKSSSVILIRAVDTKAISAGDVITFRVAPSSENPMKPRTIATHRVVKVVHEDGITLISTKGDANNKPDTQVVLGDSVMGRLVLALPYAGHLVGFAKRPWGFVVLIIVPTLFLLLGEARIILGRSRDQGKFEQNTN